MRRFAFALFLSFCSATAVFGQRNMRYHEFQMQVGTLNYKGDVANSWDAGIMLREMRPYFAVDYNFFPTPRWGFGLHTGFGRIVADDDNHDNYDRGLSFSSNLVQVNGQITYHFRDFGKWHQSQRTTLYAKLSGGIAWVNAHYPEDMTFPHAIMLAPGTNGSFNLGMGLGVKFRLTNTSVLSVEVVDHFLYSDLMEGFLLPGEEKNADQYMGLRVGYTILFL